MKNYKIWMFITVLTIFACFTIYGGSNREGNGNIINEERTVGEFNAVTLNGIGEVNIHFSANHRVVVTTDSNIQDTVTVVTENNRLKASLKRNVNNVKVIIDIYLPGIDMINLKAVGSIEIENGNGLDLEIRAASVGSIDLEKYCVENLTITGSGFGDIKIWAINSLNGDLSGVGNIHYKGSPRMNMDISGVGRIKQIK
ncbi:MAG: DUF2807 domain-containing protein [Spirochaetaceae bacterium]|nr:DUF2807 domain-containing protein [Spirochaetaceae bacterium]